MGHTFNYLLFLVQSHNQRQYRTFKIASGFVSATATIPHQPFTVEYS